MVRGLALLSVVLALAAVAACGHGDSFEGGILRKGELAIRVGPVPAQWQRVRIEGADAYVTASPCWGCFRLLANAGIKRIVFGEFYRDARAFEMANRLGIELIDMSASAPASGQAGPEAPARPGQ